jgi:hypothetical protein
MTIHKHKGHVGAIQSVYREPRRYRYEGPNAYRSGIYKGHAKVDTVRTVGEVELTIDLDKVLAKLGERAIASKSGRSTFMGGLIVARVTGTRQSLVTDTRDIPLDKGAILVED